MSVWGSLWASLMGVTHLASHMGRTRQSCAALCYKQPESRGKVFVLHRNFRELALGNWVTGSMGKSRKTPDFSWQRIASFQKNPMNILMGYWCFYSWKLSRQTTLLTRDDKALTSSFCLHNIQNCFKICSQRMPQKNIQDLYFPTKININLSFSGKSASFLLRFKVFKF